MPSFVTSQTAGRSLVIPAVALSALLATAYFLVVLPTGLSQASGAPVAWPLP